ncbi:MAG: sigma-70 family RNA polymerase sigma factor [Prevotella sp.]|nr:sigma-70 family RNA polymerase sigma factor [Prevotella sp.]
MSIFHLKPLRQLADEELMARAAAGRAPLASPEGDKAFEELYRRYARRLKGFFFLQLGGDEELAADATHDVFLRAYEARSRYEEGRSVSTWLFTIAYNICRNHYRSNAYEAQLLATLDAEPISEQQIEVQLDEATLDEALAQVLAELPAPLHQLFSLHYQEELTIPQVAEIVGIPEGTVKSRLHKTMNIIRKKLKKYENK